jgi:hypothetical protein
VQVFGTINAAESEARRIRADAHRAANVARERTNDELREEAERAKSDARRRVEIDVAKAGVEANITADEIASVTETRKAILRARAEKRLQAAAELIVDFVVNS